MTRDPSGDAAPPRTLLRLDGLRIEGRSDGAWHPLVDGIDLSLRRGEVLGLVGESGAGKSTLGLACMGYVRPGCRFAGGAVSFDGTDLIAAGPEERRRLRGRRIAYVAQSAAASFNPARRLIDQTVETAVSERLMSRQRAETAALSLYERLGLPDPDAIGQRFPHQLSGGQLQRVMAATAMLCKPDLVIFDEPTTALDVTTQLGVLKAIRDLVRQAGTAALYITHDLAVVAQMADRIVVLRHGKAIETGPTAEIIRAPREAYTRSLWAVRTLSKPEAAAEQAILSIAGLHAGYGSVPVLRDVDVEVPLGRTVSIVGESGSGKSTLARVITGLLAPQAGRITFGAAALPAMLRQRDRDTLRRIQMVPQSADTALNPRHTVRQILGRPLSLLAGVEGEEVGRRATDLLELIELGPRYLDRLPGQLSGGQKQRISIARALAANPDLLICDEVTAALDKVVQEEILKLLLRLQTELRLSYLFITHDIATVRAISDRVVVLHRGRVVEQGTRSQVLSPPHAPYTAQLLSSVPEMDPGWLDRRLESGQRSSSA